VALVQVPASGLCRKPFSRILPANGVHDHSALRLHARELRQDRLLDSGRLAAGSGFHDAARGVYCDRSSTVALVSRRSPLAVSRAEPAPGHDRSAYPDHRQASEPWLSRAAALLEQCEEVGLALLHSRPNWAVECEKPGSDSNGASCGLRTPGAGGHEPWVGPRRAVLRLVT
jgi:hypothetical protein